MIKFRRWGLSVLTMASVAAMVLLVTGWGSAMASSVSSVIVANTASNPAQVHEAGTANVHVTNTDANGNIKVAEQGTPSVNVQNFPPSQTVNRSVSVSNFPAAPATSVIGADSTALTLDPQLLIGVRDLSAYREVTLYIRTEEPNNDAVGSCDVSTEAAEGGDPKALAAWTIDSFSFYSSTTIKTYDPAPPNMSVRCTLSPVPGGPATISQNVHWLLTGRTG